MASRRHDSMQEKNAMTVESAIRLHLSRKGPCSLERLLAEMSQFSWREIFSVVDQLSRNGSLVLRRPAGFGYEVSSPSNDAVPDRGNPAF